MLRGPVNLFALAILATLLPCARSAELRLTGADSRITFDSQAQLYATCAGYRPATEWISPAEPSFVLDGTAHIVTAWLSGVSPECTTARTPCASSNADFPAYFYCVWTGGAGSVALGPFKANKTRGDDNSWLPWLRCPLPSAVEVQAAIDSHGPTTKSLALGVKHFVPQGATDTLDEVAEFAWNGAWGGNNVTISLSAPPPSIPPMPPPALPPSPLPPGTPPMTHLPHRTRLFNLYRSACGVEPGDMLHCTPSTSTSVNSNSWPNGIYNANGNYPYRMTVVTNSNELYWNADISSSGSFSQLDVGGPVEMAAASYNGACALRTDGRVRCWDSNAVSGSTQSGPDIDFGAGVTVVTLTEQGDGGMCALMEGSTCATKVMCWGTAMGGASTPTCLTQDAGTKNFDTDSSLFIIGMSGGWDHMCARFSNDGIMCWGADGSGQVSQTSSISGPVAQLGSGSFSSCALPKPLGSGPPVCWGAASNFAGLSAVQPMSSGLNPVLMTSRGYSYCFADINDDVECIGSESASSSWQSGFPSDFKIRSAE